MNKNQLLARTSLIANNASNLGQKKITPGATPAFVGKAKNLINRGIDKGLRTIAAPFNKERAIAKTRDAKVKKDAQNLDNYNQGY